MLASPEVKAFEATSAAKAANAPNVSDILVGRASGPGNYQPTWWAASTVYVLVFLRGTRRGKGERETKTGPKRRARERARSWASHMARLVASWTPCGTNQPWRKENGLHRSRLPLVAVARRPFTSDVTECASGLLQSSRFSTKHQYVRPRGRYCRYKGGRKEKLD